MFVQNKKWKIADSPAVRKKRKRSQKLKLQENFRETEIHKENC